MRPWQQLAFCTTFLLPVLLPGQQPSWFVGGMGGISTLSADAKSNLSPQRSEISLYKPENGPAFWILAGRHLNDYLSFQASYGWNRNSVKLTSTLQTAGEFTYYEQTRRLAEHTASGELMLYFRPRSSFARPYLSVGTGAAHFASSRGDIEESIGTLPAPDAFSSTDPILRVAVGIDFRLKKGFAFRYIFSETIQRNTISRQLTPPAERRLANFQNLFGLVKQF